MKKLLLLTTFCVGSLFAQVTGDIQVPDIEYKIEGKNSDVVQANCLMCHSFGYIENQGKQPKKFWVEKVAKMRHAFKAPITDEDAKTIANYLYRYYGTK